MRYGACLRRRRGEIWKGLVRVRSGSLVGRGEGGEVKAKEAEGILLRDEWGWRLGDEGEVAFCGRWLGGS